MAEKKTISVSKENYQKLKRFGLAGDSLNLAISRLIEAADRSAGAVSG